MANKKNKLNIPGIKHVSLPGTRNLFTGYGSPAVSALKGNKVKSSRFSKTNFTKQSERIISQMDFNEKKAIEILKGSPGLGATKRAREKAERGAPVFVFDTENLGQSSAGKGMFEEKPLFAITQFSFSEFSSLEEMKGSKEPEVKNIVFGVPKNAESKLRGIVKGLKEDPTKYYDLDRRTKESLADLSAMGNIDFYGGTTEVGGKLFKTISGQEEALNPTMVNLTSGEAINKMENALNILTNPELVSEPESMTDLILGLTKGGAVGIGHNPEIHDQLAIEQHLREHKAPESVVQSARSNMIDTLHLAKHVVNKQVDLDSPRNTLGSLYENITDKPFGDVMAHNAADDVKMNIAVANKLFDRTYVGKRNNREFVYPGDTFQVDSGINFYPSDFNKNEGQFDIVTKISKETGRQELQYEGLQRGTGRGDKILEYVGAIEPTEIDGVQHFGVQFYNEAEDTYHSFFRKTESGIDELFNQNLVRAGELSDEKIEYIKKDKARRRYLELFSANTKHEKDSVSNRLGVAYDILDTYDIVKKASEEGTSELEMIKITRDLVNSNKANKDYPYGLSRIEDIVYLKDKLEEERPLWQTAARQAKTSAGAGVESLTKTKRENYFMNEVFNSLVEVSEDGEYGFDGMEMLKLDPVTTVGKESHRNIQTKAQTRNFVWSQLSQDAEKGARGEKTVYTDRIFDILGDKIDPSKRNELKTKIEDGFIKGEVSPGVVDEITNIFQSRKKVLKEQGHIVSHVSGIDIETPFSQSSFGDKGLSGVLSQAKKVTDERISRKSGHLKNVFEDKEVMAILNRSDEIKKTIRDGIVNTNEKVHGVVPQVDIFRDSQSSEELKRVMRKFHDTGFQTRLEVSKDTNNLMLFATPDKNISFSDYSYDELDSMENVFGAVVPLYNENYSINTSFGNVRGIHDLRIKGANKEDFSLDDLTLADVELADVSDDLFWEISKTPEKIKEAIERGDSIEEAIAKSSGRMSAVSSDAGVPAGYGTFTSREIGYSASSRDKNRLGLLNIRKFEELYAKEHRPEAYEKFLAGRESGGSDNLYDYLDTWSGDRPIFEYEMQQEYEEMIGRLTGVNIYAEARNPNQVSRGLWNMLPSTIGNPFPAHHRPSREQGGKTLNYRMINREKLESFFTKEYGEKDIIADISANPAQSGFSNLAGREKEIKAFEVETLRIGNESLMESSINVEKRIKEERDKLTSKPGELTLPEKERIEVLNRYLNITETGLSTFEDELIFSEELGKSIRSDEFIEVGLDQYELDSRLEEHIRVQAGLKKSESFGKGEYLFDEDLSLDQMKKMGVSSEGNIITVGSLQVEATRATQGESSYETRKRRLQPEASLYGMRVDEDGERHLLIKNPYVGTSGMKVLNIDPGTRETGRFVPQELIDMFAEDLGIDSDIKAIKAFEKMGPEQRGGTASAYSDAVRTSSRNIAKAIKEMHETGTTDMQAISNYFDEGLGASPQEDYKKYIENQFIGEINEAIGSEFIEKVDSASEINNYGFAGIRVEGTPKERQESLKRLFGIATDKYGMIMEEDLAVASVGYALHDIDPWAGIGVKPKFGRVHLDLLSQVTKGPTNDQLKRIQELGEIDGYNYSSFELDLKAPGESIIERNYLELSGLGNIEIGDTYDSLKQVGMDRREQESYARSVRSALEHSVKRIGEEEIQLGGNVIVDAAGSYTFEEGSNILTFGEGEDAYHVIDGQSVKLTDRGLPSGADLKGTYGNLDSVNVYSDSMNTTIGDLVKEQNSSVYVKLMDEDNPLAEGALLKNNVIEAVPMLSGDRFGDTFQMQVERSQMRAMEAAHTLSYGTPQGYEDSADWISDNLDKVRKNVEEFEKSAGRFLGSDATKEYEIMHRENSMSYYLSGRNPLHTKYRTQDLVMGEEQARTLIRGHSDTMLTANERSMTEVISASGLTEEDFYLLDGSRQDSIKEDYIIDQITGAYDEENQFEVYGISHREPVQDEGSLVGVSIRVDDTGEFDGGNMSIDPRLAARFGGDYDGDAAYITSFSYLQFDTKEGALATQKELSEFTRMTTGLALADNHDDMILNMFREGKNTYSEIMELVEKSDIDSVFSDNISEMQTLLQLVSDESMQTIVGTSYHSIGAVRDALRYTTDAASLMDSSQENLESQRSIQSQATALLSNVQQESISKKKMGLDQVLKYAGYEDDQITPQGIVELFDSGQLMDDAKEFNRARIALPKKIENISEQSAPKLHEELIRLDILQYKDTEEGELLRESHLDTFTQIGRRNDAWASSAFGTFGSKALKHGQSSADENSQKIIESIIEQPGSVPFTPKLQKMAEQQIGDQPEKIAAWKESSKRTTEQMLENIARLDEKAQSAGPTFDESNNILKQISQSDIGAHQVRSQSDAFNMVTDTAASVMTSNHFKAAAGIAAGWTAARIMSKGPTPEGNLAEREQATPQEVAPSQLLTSPTARVTPGAEAVNLNISGEGNLTEEEAATIVNNEIGAMTGTTMNMNITKKDNTAKLDNRFYQKAVDGVFGF